MSTDARTQPSVCKEQLIPMDNIVQLIPFAQLIAKMMRLLAPTVDARGCQEATLCRAKGTDKDGELCLGVCPPTCGADEILTAGSTDEKGCETAPTCVPII